MQLNTKTQPIYTHEGVKAKHINPLQQLKRSVLSCLLWEREFYEDGQTIADRIASLVNQCDPVEVSKLAIAARSEFRLRHVPLLLAREMARTGGPVVGTTLEAIIQRADELTEFVALYWKDGKQPLSAQVKKGLAQAFTKFDAYQLAKYDRANSVRLRDVLFMCHPKPKDDVQEQNWKKLVNGNLPAPDTWEVALSSGEDKKASFERLLSENNLGYMALLRNLRNMQQSGVNESLVFNALDKGAEKSKALPFRYLAAARAVPQWEPQIDKAMQKAMTGMNKLSGKTVLLVDVSGSMDWDWGRLSGKSDLNRMDAAGALAVLTAGITEQFRCLTFSNSLVEVPPRQGMALIDAINGSQSHGGTLLGQAVSTVDNQIDYDRLIVITDEQSHDRVPDPKGRGYMINVASNQNGVGYGKWTHIDGFSEAVIRFIQEYEQAN